MQPHEALELFKTLESLFTSNGAEPSRSTTRAWQIVRWGTREGIISLFEAKCLMRLLSGYWA